MRLVLIIRVMECREKHSSRSYRWIKTTFFLQRYIGRCGPEIPTATVHGFTFIRLTAHVNKIRVKSGDPRGGLR